MITKSSFEINSGSFNGGFTSDDLANLSILLDLVAPLQIFRFTVRLERTDVFTLILSPIDI